MHLMTNAEQHNTAELKRMNLINVYNCLYQAGEASRLEISARTGLSLPTVASNITELEEKGLVLDVGEQKSTGGRRARAFRCQNMARIAIGAEILKHSVRIAAIDLYGNIIKEEESDAAFSNSDQYYSFFGSFVNAFVDGLEVPLDRILGVGIALQGLVSADGETVVYSPILKCTGTGRERFQRELKLPCIILHDTESSALAEIWHDKSIDNIVYFALNRNFGGTLILNGRIHNSMNLSSSVIEHMCLDPNGPICYCGKHGCVESFCSVNHLLDVAGMDIGQFFEAVRNGDHREKRIWKEYLKYLAMAIENVRMVANCDFILGGYLVQFMTDKDYEDLSGYVSEQSFLNDTGFVLRRSRYGDKAPTLGAAMHYVDRFLAELR